MIRNIHNKYVLFLTFVGLLTFNACNLTTVPESNLSNAVYWQTDDDFRQAANDLYDLSMVNYTAEDYPLIADVMSDNAILTPFSTISNGSYLPSANFGPWNEDYSLIRMANNIIEKARTASFQSANLPRFEGEAMFFRAYGYADLVRRYGDVPLILKTLDIDSKGLLAPRTDRETVIDTIYRDLDYAAANLPTASELDPATEWGMVTKGAALALESRVALREGTWNKFHSDANFKNHLQIAKDAALKVMQSGEYQLFTAYGDSSYKRLFKQDGEDPATNKEAIWVWLYGPDNQSAKQQIRLNNYSAKTAQGEYAISRSLVNSYLCTDGLPIDQSPLYKGETKAYSEFENRDPRLNGTVIKKGDIYGQASTPFIPNLNAPSGYFITKYYDEDQGSGPVNVMIIRYAEVLLNYAEATYELDDAISDADLDMSINLLRDRVNMPHLTNAFVTAHGLNMRSEIRRERRVELGMEGFRYDDLLRWKTAELELPKATEGVRLFAAEYPGVDPATVNMTADSIVIVEPASKRHFDASKQYLWPLPVDQLALNPNLKQNPGW
jgi:hypothetical protein